MWVKLCRDMPDKAVAEMERLRLLVEGVNNKIRVLQRRAYGYPDEEYLKLKIAGGIPSAITQKCRLQPTRIRVDPYSKELTISRSQSGRFGIDVYTRLVGRWELESALGHDLRTPLQPCHDTVDG